MRDRTSQVGIQVSIRAASRTAAPEDETPFRIAVLGDFSGRAQRGVIDPAGALLDRGPVRVDRDNLGEVLARLAPRLILPSEPRIEVGFESLEDFHPDSLFGRLPIFDRLRTARGRLSDPATAADALRELTGRREAEVPTEAEPPRAAPDDLLDQIVSRSEGPGAEDVAASSSELDALVRRIASPYVEPDEDPRAPHVLEGIEAASSSLLRALLHHPHFQALEASWRALDFLTRRIETDSALQIHLFDISRPELAADGDADSDLASTALYRALVESSVETPGAAPWSLLVGDFAFGPDEDDALLLARLGAIASLAGAPWISAARPALAGLDSFAVAPDPADWRSPPTGGLWEALRRESQARYLGLAAPRFLLRLPYGADSEPCESLAFEEITEPPDHDDYLWGNPAYLCALLLARSFRDQGWSMRPGTHREVRGLPLHLYVSQGDTEAKPCAEATLSERAAERLIECGLIPLLSVKETDSVRLIRLASLAEPPAPLEGRWLSGSQG